MSIIDAPEGRRSPPLELEHVLRPGFVLRELGENRWSLGGELDCSSGAMLVPAAAATLPSAPVLYLDCADLQFIDVAGWRALGVVRRQLEPATELRLCHPSTAARRLFRVIGHP